MRQIADAGRDTGTSVTLCGEMAGKPLSAMALMGVGYRAISMSPAAIGPVKAMLTELPLGALTELMDETLNGQTCEKDLVAMLQSFAAEHDIPL